MMGKSRRGVSATDMIPATAPAATTNISGYRLRHSAAMAKHETASAFK